MLTITTTSTGLTAIIFFIIGLTLYRAWKKEMASGDLKLFSFFMIYFGFQQFFFSIATGLLANNPSASNWLWAIAHIFMFLGIAYFLRFTLRMKSLTMEKRIFKIVLAISAIGEGILIYNVPKLEPFLLDNLIYNWEVPPMAGATIGIFTTISLLLCFWVFISNFWKLKDKLLRFRSLALGFGVLIFLVGGPMHNFITTPLSNFIADVTLVGGVFLMAFGVYIPRIFKSNNTES